MYKGNVRDAGSSLYDYGVNTGTKLQSYMQSAGSTLYDNGLALRTKMQNIIHSTDNSIDNTIDEIIPSAKTVENLVPNV